MSIVHVQRNQKIIHLYTEGASLRDVAREVGLTHECIRQVLKKSKVAVRDRSSISPEDYDRAVALLRNGMPVAHIAEEVGHSPSALVRRFERDGYYKREDRSQPWTAKEERIVRSGYGRRSARMIAAQIGRTRNEVIGKARRLGLGKPQSLEAAE